MADNQDTPMDIGEDKSSPSSDQLLLDLMTALATGARAVQGLPSGDEFEYRSSLPEFRHLVEDSQESLLESLLMVLEDAAVVMPSFHGGNNQTDAGSMFHFESLDDPLLWETCMDLCDALLEQAEHSGNEKIAKDLVAARGYAQSSFGRLLNGIVEMEKPQQVFQFGAWNNPEMNDRTQIFVPPFLEKKYFAKQELDVEALKQPGHGMDTKFGETKSSMRVLPSNVIAPSHHILHAYLPELEALEYPDWELEAPAEKVKIAKEDNLIDSAVWIDTPVALNDLKTKLEHPSVQEVAIDLEAHSYRSFAGMICLIQITCVDSETGKLQDYLLDPFPLWNLIHKALAPTLANPHVVKIFHGADSDMAWLQRDFGLFVVNLFDTGRAAMALKLPSYGFAHVLERYVKGAKADKTHQLSDWRQRPLPEAMKEYAIIDTHYLLDIYSAMKYDIAKSKTTSIKVVLEESRKVCTIRYTPELFRPDGYRNLADCHGQKIELNHIQEEVLKELWDWRDQTARQSDESHAYVCTNTHLMRLAMACPTNLSAFQGLMQPMPPMLIRNSKEILTSIQNCILKHQRSKKVRGSHLSSAFFKPAVSTRSEDMEDAGGNRPSPRTLMSPVLGTEALYRQAGWVTPAHPPKSDSEVEDILTTSATEDDADDEKDEEDSCRSGSQPSKTGKDKKSSRKNRRSSLAVNDVNRNFQADRLSSHSMQMGNCQSTDEEGNIIDGFGPVRVSHRLQEELDEATGSAKSNAAQIRTTQECRGIIGLISSSELGGDELEDEDEEGDTQEEEKQQEDFVIPRSMREIYRISNRNRRNKKSSSPGPPEPNKEELEELAKAEKVLKARSSEGKNYVDVIPVVTGSPKRQRTKSVGGASISSSDEAGGTGHDSFNKSREDDIALMQEVGWIVSKEELDSMITQGHQSDKDDDDSIDGGRRGRETPKTFDYSNVGPIGAFAPAPSSNPFFAGAALQGGHLNQQFGKFDRKKSTGTSQGGSKPSRHQIERPEKRNERAQAFKKK
jgi:exosome complex exonuclease RRP6